MAAAQSRILGELTIIEKLVRNRLAEEDRIVADLRAELAELLAEVTSLRMAVAHLRGSQAALPPSLRPVVARGVLAASTAGAGNPSTG